MSILVVTLAIVQLILSADAMSMMHYSGHSQMMSTSMHRHHSMMSTHHPHHSMMSTHHHHHHSHQHHSMMSTHHHHHHSHQHHSMMSTHMSHMSTSMMSTSMMSTKVMPTLPPAGMPTMMPTSSSQTMTPTAQVTSMPSVEPTTPPSAQPTTQQPSAQPTTAMPTSKPTAAPSTTASPTMQPTPPHLVKFQAIQTFNNMSCADYNKASSAYNLALANTLVDVEGTISTSDVSGLTAVGCTTRRLANGMPSLMQQYIITSTKGMNTYASMTGTLQTSLNTGTFTVSLKQNAQIYGAPAFAFAVPSVNITFIDLSSATSSSSSSSSLSGGAIAGIVIGAIVGIALIGVAIYFGYVQYKTSQQLQLQEANAQADTFNSIDNSSI